MNERPYVQTCSDECAAGLASAPKPRTRRVGRDLEAKKRAAAAWRATNREHIAAYNKARREAGLDSDSLHPERKRERVKAWKARNPELVAIQRARYKAKHADAIRDRERLRRRTYKPVVHIGPCVECGKMFTKPHGRKMTCSAPCERAYAKKKAIVHYHAHIHERRAAAREYHHANKEKNNARKRAWNKANPVRKRENNRRSLGTKRLAEAQMAINAGLS